MNTKILTKVEEPFIRKDIQNFNSGDTISVHTIIREGDKKRKQIFQGIVLATKGSGTRKSFTVRKISFGVGVEKIFPVNSPNIEKLEVLKKGNVRRSKIYYMRKRVGKMAMKIKEATVKNNAKEKQNTNSEKSEE